MYLYCLRKAYDQKHFNQNVWSKHYNRLSYLPVNMMCISLHALHTHKGQAIFSVLKTRGARHYLLLGLREEKEKYATLYAGTVLVL